MTHLDSRIEPLRWRSHYSPTSHYPSYVGWFVVMSRPTQKASIKTP